MTELKSCPFCGSEAKLHEKKSEPIRYWVNCTNKHSKRQYCRGNVGPFSEKDRALEAWNNRQLHVKKGSVDVE